MVNRCLPWQIGFMKRILLALCTLSLLTATGCIFPGGRYHDDRGRDHWQGPGHDDHPGGMDHGDHPGDHDHD